MIFLHDTKALELHFALALKKYFAFFSLNTFDIEKLIAAHDFMSC